MSKGRESQQYYGRMQPGKTGNTERFLRPEESLKLKERGLDPATARKALKQASIDARQKESNLRASNGPSSTPAQHYEKSVKALPPPPERDPDE